ncbi:hypothetical protein GCM10010472_26730 [Pseudonocardia halophobica]|uniref:Uncharacterized protein n=1 Tax=Pseudonocardia halophobica TaxID=29401 RepID=A0A9W6KX90_9PSEU|nr:DUF6541 family protein [Pseudonocardia halophobica]GLL08932.1 hypothetical protein GCM10017577_00720 [Pseudonocardia halophobica]
MSLHAILPLVALALVPGLVLGAALGLRGWVLVGAAPVLTFGVVGIAGPLVPALGLRWSPVTFVGAVLVLAAVGLGARLGLAQVVRSDPPAAEERPFWGPHQHLGVAAGLVVATGTGLWIGWNATQGLTAMPQWWDAFWHMNAVQFIRETGASGPGALQALNNPSTTNFFYPNGFHVLAATLSMLTGIGPVAAIDATVTVLGGAFALGTAALVRACGGRAAVAAAAALLSCAFTGFPYDVVAWGPLFPYATGLAMIPALLALVATLLRRRSGNPVGVPAATAVGALGVLALHPSVLIAALVFAAALLVQESLRRGPRAGDLGASAVVGLIALVLGLPFVRAALGATEGTAVDWAATVTPSDAIGAVLTFGHGQAHPQYWLAGLCLVALLRRRAVRPMAWFVVSGAVFAGLFVLAASYEGSLVATLTRPWWNDRWRFAALWSLAAVLPAAAGLVTLSDLLTRVVRRLRVFRGPRVALASSVSLAVVAGLVVVGTEGLYHGRNEARLANAYLADRSVGPDERRVYDYLARLVPPGQPVMNDPFDGSAAMWALSGVRPLFASPTIEPQELVEMDPDRRILWTSFRDIGRNPSVRAAADRLGVHYVVLGEGFIAGEEHVLGLRRLAGSPGLVLVHVDGDARVYRIEP